MGFITSPLDFADLERQVQALTRLGDTPLPRQTDSEVEEHRGFEVSPVETNREDPEESGEHAGEDKKPPRSIHLFR